MDWIDSINGIFSPQYQPFYLIDATNNRRIQCVMTSHQTDFTGDDLNMEYVGANNILTLDTADACWEAVTPTVVSGSLSNGQALIVNNPSRISVYPVISLSPGCAEIDNFRLSVENNSGNVIQIESAGAFKSGTVMIIDSVEGAVTLQSVNINSAIAGGSLPFLLPGSNTLRYASAFSPVNITVSFRRAWTI